MNKNQTKQHTLPYLRKQYILTQINKNKKNL